MRQNNNDYATNPDVVPIKEKDIYKAMCIWGLHKPSMFCKYCRFVISSLAAPASGAAENNAFIEFTLQPDKNSRTAKWALAVRRGQSIAISKGNLTA
jgi:hypothetical protein